MALDLSSIIALIAGFGLPSVVYYLMVEKNWKQSFVFAFLFRGLAELTKRLMGLLGINTVLTQWVGAGTMFNIVFGAVVILASSLILLNF